MDLELNTRNSCASTPYKCLGPKLGLNSQPEARHPRNLKPFPILQFRVVTFCSNPESNTYSNIYTNRLTAVLMFTLLVTLTNFDLECQRPTEPSGNPPRPPGLPEGQAAASGFRVYGSSWVFTGCCWVLYVLVMLGLQSVIC